MYRDYYLEVMDVANKIRSNPTEKPIETPELSSGFIQPRKADIKGAILSAKPEKEPVERVVLNYVQGVRQSSVTGRYEDMIPASVPRDSLPSALEAIGKIESGGNYQAMGPVVQKGMYKGQRAVGKYQVMEGNIGPWSKEVLGFELTKEEFLANPRYQDMIAGFKLAQARDKHGSWDDAASVWFSGRPLAKAGNVSDGYNTVPEYVSKFRRAMV